MTSETESPATLKRIQELRKEGHSLRKMADMLQSEGFPPPGRAKKWNHMGVQWCLSQLDRQVTTTPAEPPTPPTLKVYVHGPYTTTDRRLWDFLLHTVWAELDKPVDHTLPLERALDAIRAVKGRPNREHLSEALDRLAGTRVKLEGKIDRHQLTVMTPLLAAALTEDTLSFHFPPPLVKLVKNPQQYARLQALLEGKR